MTTTPPELSQRITQQFLFTAVTEGLLIIGVALLFIVEPLTPLTTGLAAAALAIGLVGAVFTIYRAVRLMNEPRGRTVAHLSILLIVLGPLMIFALSFVI